MDYNNARDRHRVILGTLVTVVITVVATGLIYVGQMTLFSAAAQWGLWYSIGALFPSCMADWFVLGTSVLLLGGTWIAGVILSEM